MVECQDEDHLKGAQLLKQTVDMAMATAFGRSPTDPSAKFVAKIDVCKAVPFYGYHAEWHKFYKIYLSNPAFVTKLSGLFQSGKLTGTETQVYEAHIPYLLAFLADYNLYGCGFLSIEKYGMRPQNGIAVTANNGLELDVECQDILNRRRLGQIKDFDLLQPSPATGVKIDSLREIRFADEKRRAKLGVSNFEKKVTPFDGQQQQWARQQEWEAKLADRIADSLSEFKGNLGAEAFRQQDKYPLIPTAFETVGPARTLDETLSNIVSTQEDTSKTSQLIKVSTSQRKQMPSFTFSMSFSEEEQSQAALKAAEMLVTKFSPVQDDEKSSLLAFGHVLNSTPPSRHSVRNSVGLSSFPTPFYSKAGDVSLFPFVFAGKEYNIRSKVPSALPRMTISPDLQLNPLNVSADDDDLLLGFQKWALAKPPPSRQSVVEWFEKDHHSQQSTVFLVQSLGEAAGTVDEGMTLLSLELHVRTRPKKAPSFTEDEILAVFWEYNTPFPMGDAPTQGVITWTPIADQPGVYQLAVDSEGEMIREVIKMTHFFDPDILYGFEVQSKSWGYLCSRATAAFGIELKTELARAKQVSKEWRPPSLAFSVSGRHLIDLWKVLRKEVTLPKYTLEHVVFHALHERTARYSYDELTKWWTGELREQRIVLNYYTRRTHYNVRLLAHFEIISRNATMGRVVGIDFFSALTRGSQFNVESVLCRLTRRENFILPSPSKHQVGQQNALEYIPMVMEPVSDLYVDPVCVLDFRSLYPSIVIAYNLCYSTLVTRAELWRDRNKVGFVQDLVHPPGLVALLKDDIHMAPNGIGYVRQNVRKSMVASMLEEILDHRFLLKDSLKFHKDDLRYQRNLDNQQRALKFIANVTYGYTSASFSGRMPCTEVADSIVATGREILTRAIKMIEGCEKWGIKPKVVYGDTDSLFVKLPSTSREHAFAIGREMADMVTAANPDPILLKLEKVYHPCILLAKKRYVGHSYEHPSSDAYFDAKGTETIRRDNTPIVQKVERKALEILFQSSDLSKVKSYLQNTWRKILSGKVSVQDFCFAQEVKLGTYKAAPTSLPGGAVVSLRKMQEDEAAGPQYLERVPFVVCTGAPGSRITDRCYSPEEVMENPDLNIDAEYYINQNIIPPLERLFNIFGANVRAWYQDLPRAKRIIQGTGTGRSIRGFLSSNECPICRTQSDSGICENCRDSPSASLFVVQSRLQQRQHKLAQIERICRLCDGHHAARSCRSIDCSVLGERHMARVALDAVVPVTDELIAQLF